MALTGKTIGQLDHLTSSLTGNEAFPIQYSGATYHISQSQIVSGLATTGSNTFTGVQTISGSNGILKYSGNAASVNPSSPTLADIHAVDSYPWLERFYNDSFSQQDVVMAYFAWNDGRFVFHNESNQSIGLQVNGYNAENGLLVYPDKVAFVNNIEITGSIKAPSITGSLFGTASWAQNASTASLALQVSTSISTQNQQHNVLFVDTSGPGYIQVDGGLRYNPNQDLLTTTASFALNASTASSADNFTVRGTLTATTIVAQTITASTEFITGSSKFGSLITDTHQFTGSVSITGSLNIASGLTTFTSTLSGSQPSNNPSASLILISGSITPTGSLSGSSAVLMNTVMSASAHSQSLVGIEIAPRFNNGAFTNTTNTALKVSGSVQVTGSINATGNISTTGTLFANGAGFAGTFGTLTLTNNGVAGVAIGVTPNPSLTTAASLRVGSTTNMTANAIFGATSATNGVILPNLTTVARTNLSGSANRSLIVYDTGTTTEGYWYYATGSTLQGGWQKFLSNTGSQDISGSITASSALISGPLTVTDSLLLSTGSMFGLPTTSSTTPVTGSMFWSGSLLFVWNGSRYMSASFV
jgi:hypothetical protein